MDTTPNHSFKSLTKAWLLAALATGCTCFGFAQSFENDFGIIASRGGDTLIFAGTHTYPGFSDKYSVREDWVELSESEILKTTYYEEAGRWDFYSSTYYKNGVFVSERFDWDHDYSETLIEGSPTPSTVQYNVPHSAYEVLRSHLEGDSNPYGTIRIDYTETLVGIELVETVLGRIPALKFEGTQTTTLDGDYLSPGTYELQYIYWAIPGLDGVKGSGFYPDTDEIYSYELTETTLNFEPKPLPILDSGNPVWNMFGYTWDMGGGWQESFEFGSLWTDTFPWIWSDDMQSWLYVQGDRKSCWAWMERTATWIWTNQELYPWTYDSVTFQWTYVE